jgi:hypothetical protein
MLETYGTDYCFLVVGGIIFALVLPVAALLMFELVKRPSKSIQDPSTEVIQESQDSQNAPSPSDSKS